MDQIQVDSSDNSGAARPSLPVDMDVTGLLRWYATHARTLEWRVSPSDRQRGVCPDPYRVWLSEIMLQQTTVVTATPYFRQFVHLWPDVDSLARAEREEILQRWAGLGYYARARNLHACARIISGERGGSFPADVPELLKLPGIGPYTAAAIAAICFDAPVAVVDTNVARIVSRLMALEQPVKQSMPRIREAVQGLVPTRSGDFAQALMDLGAAICTPRRPNCSHCPLNKGCRAAGSGTPEAFPLRPRTASRPERNGHAFVIRRADGAVFLQERADTGLLAGMCQVPGSQWQETSPAPPEFPPFREQQEGRMAPLWQECGQVRHVFSHFALQLQVWKCDLAPDAPADIDLAGRWCPPDQLANAALPTLYVKVLKQAEIM